MYIRNIGTLSLHPWVLVEELAAQALTRPGAFGVDMAALVSDLSVGENLSAVMDAFFAAEAIHSDYDPDQEWAKWANYLSSQSLVGV